MSKIKNGWVPAEAWDSTDRLDLSKARRALAMPKLKYSTTVMNVRMPVSLVNRLKVEANKRDVPYQSFVKILLSEAVEKL